MSENDLLSLCFLVLPVNTLVWIWYRLQLFLLSYISKGFPGYLEGCKCHNQTCWHGSHVNKGFLKGLMFNTGHPNWTAPPPKASTGWHQSSADMDPMRTRYFKWDWCLIPAIQHWHECHVNQGFQMSLMVNTSHSNWTAHPKACTGGDSKVQISADMGPMWRVGNVSSVVNTSPTIAP